MTNKIMLDTLQKFMFDAAPVQRRRCFPPI